MTDKIIENIPNITFICAPPKCGKSYFVKYLLNELFKKKKLKYGIVFTGFKHNGDFDFLPQKYVHSKYDENVLKKFYNIQIKQIQKKGKAPPAFIIFDDMLGSLNFNSGFIATLIPKYRQPNFTIIFTTQYVKKLPPLIRECATFFMMFKTTGKDTTDTIQENFMQEKTKKEVVKFIDQNLPSIEARNFILVEKLALIDDKYTIDRAPAKYKPFKIKY